MEQLAEVDVRRFAGSFHTKTGWLDSRHCFSFGEHFDPRNTGHGLLTVLNDDIVSPSKGFDRHFHQDMEIVTWVLDGELEHRDSLGNSGVIRPGLVQRMSAGAGVWHAEFNPDRRETVHFLQMWVLPDSTGGEPSYEQAEVRSLLKKGGLRLIASGRRGRAPITIKQKGAALWVGRLEKGERAALPDGRHVHVYVARGSAKMKGAGRLEVGDSARLADAGTLGLIADRKSGAEVVVWETL